MLHCLSQGSATFTVQRAILPYFPTNKICLEPQKLFELISPVCVLCTYIDQTQSKVLSVGCDSPFGGFFKSFLLVLKCTSMREGYPRITSVP